jgi:hypothetical protein
MKYAKLLTAVAVAILAAAVAAMTGDQYISNVEWINIAIAGVGACSVFAAPNVPHAMFTKTIIAALTAVLAFLVSAITDGVSTSEWLQIGVIAAGAFGVFAIPNKTDEVLSTAALK